ncbi:LamG-like jellyroll fold domain-containing protein [Catelliglobosispora koreensis]
MNDAAGAATLADESGNSPPAAVLNGATLGAPGRLLPGNDGVSRTAISFDGVDDVVETSGPVIDDTTKNFSVAAWVKLGDLSTSRTIVSQSGSSGEFFALEYSSSGVWRFRSTTADTAGAAANPNADSTSPARLNTWTHLAVSYDEAINAFDLYVNGTREARVSGITLWDANGPTRVGKGFKGSLAGVQLWERRVSFAEAQWASDALLVGGVGTWLMEEIGPGPTYDSSGMQHDLDFFGGAQIPPSGAGKEGTGLRLDGLDDYAACAEPVLYPDQSFTVSAWVRLAATDREQVILSQAGFTLAFSPGNGGQWRLRLPAAGSNAAADTIAAAPATGATTDFHHLIGVFDAQKRELRLYVDTTTAPVITPMNPLWTPWNASGPFLIGQFAAADIDQIRVYQGIVRDLATIK